jgi:hypothetical protein
MGSANSNRSKISAITLPGSSPASGIPGRADPNDIVLPAGIGSFSGQFYSYERAISFADRDKPFYRIFRGQAIQAEKSQAAGNFSVLTTHSANSAAHSFLIATKYQAG